MNDITTLRALNLDHHLMEQGFGTNALPLGENMFKYEKSRSGISFGASEIVGISPAETSSILQSVIRICESLEKQELMITNIVPNFRPGKDDLTTVPDVQDEIVDLFAIAFAAQRKSLPVNRLVLRRGEFDIRFYVRDEKPIDFFADEVPLSGPH